MTRLSGTHVVITGGSSGIGLATAHALVAQGAKVSLLARDSDRLDAAAAAVGEADVVVTATVDVTDPTAVDRALQRVTAEFGPCEVLITCAGTAHPGYFEQLDADVFREQMEVDYFGTLHPIRAVVPSMMERRRGHIVTISSTVGLIGVFGYSAYAPAKFAVRGLAETLRSELAPYDIVVACAFPPDTNTPGLDRENELKPVETARISAAIRPRGADHVARAIVRGIERDRLVITADFQTAALARAAGMLAPYVRRSTDRQVRRARRDR
ncbi:MAG TPA: SDR family oxidoreductase [Acidimicrobiia bacterium]